MAQLIAQRPRDRLYIDWWLMNHCSWSCSYCADIIRNGTAATPDLAAAEYTVRNIAAHAKTQGLATDWYLTGGEVTEWPWLVDLLRTIQQTGGAVGIRSNAHLALGDWARVVEHVDRVVMEFHTEYTSTAHFLMCLKAVRDQGKTANVTVSMKPDRWAELEAMISKINELWPDQGVHRRMLFQDPAVNHQPMQYTPQQEIKLNRQSGPLLWISDQGEEEYTDYQTLILEGKNRFRGQQCRVGLEQIVIDAWGRVYRSHCRVKGVLATLGEPIKWPTEAVECPREYCGNGFDINATKG